MIKCIIFDFDGTLVGGMSLWISALKQTLSRLGVDATSTDLEEEIRSSFDDRTSGSPWRKLFNRRCPGKEAEAWALLLESIERAMEKEDFSANFKFFLQMAKSKGVKIGIVTFRTRDSVEEKLAKMKVSHLFDVIIGSGDTVEEKPSPQPFLMASKRMGVEPDECLVIGDEPADIIGGNQAGMQTIGVLVGISNRDMLKKTRATKIIQSLDELPNLIGIG